MSRGGIRITVRSSGPGQTRHPRFPPGDRVHAPGPDGGLAAWARHGFDGFVDHLQLRPRRRHEPTTQRPPSGLSSTTHRSGTGSPPRIRAISALSSGVNGAHGAMPNSAQIGSPIPFGSLIAATILCRCSSVIRLITYLPILATDDMRDTVLGDRHPAQLVVHIRWSRHAPQLSVVATLIGGLGDAGAGFVAPAIGVAEGAFAGGHDAG